MKRNLFITIAAVIVASSMLYASHTQNSSAQYTQGTVVRVQKQVVSSPADALTTPTDAPLASRDYAYEVAVRVDCKTFTGRYETAFDYLPSAFTVDHPIQVRAGRHAMYFDLPNHPEMRMGIVHRSTVSSADCGQNR